MPNIKYLYQSFQIKKFIISEIFEKNKIQNHKKINWSYWKSINSIIVGNVGYIYKMDDHIWYTNKTSYFEHKNNNFN